MKTSQGTQQGKFLCVVYVRKFRFFLCESGHLFVGRYLIKNKYIISLPHVCIFKYKVFGTGKENFSPFDKKKENGETAHTHKRFGNCNKFFFVHFLFKTSILSLFEYTSPHKNCLFEIFTAYPSKNGAE